MSYLVLARKYRPQTFEDLVGQIPVSQTLLNALQSGRIAHAYIFSGPRGVGKTTTARLLAKCLNCEKGPAIKPCNKCPSCLSIAQGSSVQDVLEIDGASNRGIEQIRELRESAKYTPSASRYRIYIIDEAHQITKDAFGALLKTLEEPPEHVIFMMATTEVQKIPAPILSRCQRFSLRPIAPDLVLKHLKEICQKEKIKVDEAALADIVRFVEGSLRDALSLLDQALVFSPEGITSETLRQLLGLLPRDIIQTATRKIAAGDPAEILRWVSQSVQDGIDITQLGKDLQDYYHTLLLLKAGVEDVFQTDLKALQAEAAKFDFPTLERAIRLLSRALEEMRRSENPRAVFEIYVLKMGQKILDPRTLIEKLEKFPATTAVGALSVSRPSVGPGKPELRPSPPPAAPAPAPSPAPARAIEKSSSVSKPATASTSTSPSRRLSSGEFETAWPNLIHAVGEQKMTLASALEEAAATFEATTLTLTFPNAFSQQLVMRSLAFLKPLLLQHLGTDVAVETRVENGVKAEDKKANAAIPSPAPSPAPGPAVPNAPPDVEMEDVPMDAAEAEIQKVMKYFPGTLKKEKKSS